MDEKITPVHQSILEPMTICGLPYNLCTCFLITTIILVFVVRALIILPFAVVIFLCMGWYSKDDPAYKFAFFKKSMKEPSRLEP